MQLNPKQLVVSRKEKNSLSIKALFLLMLPTFVSFAQDSLSIAKFDYNGNEFSPKMNEFIHKRTNDLGSYLGHLSVKNSDLDMVKDSACDVGLAIIKFKVKAGIGLTEVACTKSTNPILARIFKAVVQHSSQYWTARGDSSLYYLLSIRYNFLNACQSRPEISSEVRDIFEFDDGVHMKNAKSVILHSWGFSTGVVDTFGEPIAYEELKNSRRLVEKVIRNKEFRMDKLPQYVSVTQDTNRTEKPFQVLRTNNEEIRKAIDLNRGHYYFTPHKYAGKKQLEKYGLVYDDYTNVHYLICDEKIITAIIFKNGKLISYFTTLGKDGRRRPWIL